MPLRSLLRGVLACTLIALSCPGKTDEIAPQLERVVIFMRHGVRPPTKSAEALAPLADRAWPDPVAWGAAPGELTPHGAAAIRKFAADLRRFYAHERILPGQGQSSGDVFIWADGADQRTVATAKAVAEVMAPDAPPAVAARPRSDPDPLFNALEGSACRMDPVLAEKAVRDAGPIDTAETKAALRRLQQIFAPNACSGGAGECLDGATRIVTSETGIKLSGPLATGATLSEDLLLEYENGFADGQFAWGRASRADLDVVLAAHQHAAELTRRLPYIAVHRAAPLVRFVLDTLGGRPAAPGMPTVGDRSRLIILVGHDTNLSNLDGVFDLSLRLPGQPDATAPGTAIAFERWHVPVSNSTELRLRVFYQDPDQVRELSDEPIRKLRVIPGSCRSGSSSCELGRLSTSVLARLPAACR